MPLHASSAFCRQLIVVGDVPGLDDLVFVGHDLEAHFALPRDRAHFDALLVEGFLSGILGRPRAALDFWTAALLDDYGKLLMSLMSGSSSTFRIFGFRRFMIESACR
jgi:hypothetical protein